MRTSAPKKGKAPNKRFDITPLRTMLRDRRIWTALGVVTKPDASTERFEADGTDVLVHVVIVPENIEVTCRLGVMGGGPGIGFWAVPPEGAEVAIIFPTGETDFMPIIVAVLSTGTLPDRVSADRWTIVSAVPVEITAPKVVLGPDPGTVIDEQDGFVHGTGIDTASTLPYWMLGSTTTKVVGKK